MYLALTSVLLAATVTPPAAWVSFEDTYASLASYSARVTFFEREGTQVQNSVLDFTFAKPTQTTIHFLSGKNAGVTLDWNGGTTVTAHRGSGLLAIFKRSFDLHDAEMKSIRGDTVDQLNFGAFIEHVQATPGALTQGPPAQNLAAETVSLTFVPASPAADGGVTREVVDLSVATHVPVRITAYEGETLVREIDFASVNLTQKK